MALISIEEQSGAKPRSTKLAGHPLLALGFRPFYLLAAAFATVSIPVWLARYFGHAPGLSHVSVTWHMHEMIFGFAIAVIIGFLYTAARNWTGLQTPRGATLAAIAGLWIAGRIAMCTADPRLAAAIDISFIPVAAWPLYRVLQRSGNKRNMILVGLLTLLTIANAVFHAAALGWIGVSPALPVQAAIMVVVIIESVIGGRVIPSFTANAVQGVRPIMNARRDLISILLTACAGIAWAFSAPAPLTAMLMAAAAIAQLVRLAGWKPLCSIRNPLLWIMHLSYAWIPVGFMLLALASLGLVTSSAAFHVLAIGAIAGLIIGMITRTALGHTGRQLKAGRSETVMYALIQLGVVARFIAAVSGGSWHNPALVAAAACWSCAFLLYLVVYAPYLFRPRIDGREG